MIVNKKRMAKSDGSGSVA